MRYTLHHLKQQTVGIFMGYIVNPLETTTNVGHILWNLLYTLQKTQQTVGIFMGYIVYPLENTTNGGHILWNLLYAI